MVPAFANGFLVLCQYGLLDLFSGLIIRRISHVPIGAVALLPTRHRDEKSGSAFDDSDFANHKTVVEGDYHIGFDYLLVGWIDSNFRNLHAHSSPNVTASTRWKISQGIAICPELKSGFLVSPH